MSLDLASRLFDWASIALAVGACIVFVATLAIVPLGIVKEHHWSLLREQANERIAKLGLETANANAALGTAQAEIAKANARIAEADARTIEAGLKLEQLRKELGPRQLQRDIFLKELAGQPSGRVEILYLQDVPECFDLAQQIWRALEDAKWLVVSPKPIPSLIFSDSPTAMSVDGQPAGVTVAVYGITQEESEATMNAHMGREWVKTPYTVLMRALASAIGKVAGHAGGPNRPPDGTLRVVVAPR